MGVIIRQSIKSTLVTYVGILIGIVNRLFLLPKFLTVEQIGLLDVIVIIAMLLAKISALGTNGAMTKFFSYYKEKNTLKPFLGLIGTVSILGYVVLAGIFILFPQQIIDLFPKDKILLGEYYYFILPIAIFLIIREYFATYSLNNMRLTFPSIIEHVSIRLTVFVLLLLFGFGYITFHQYVSVYTLSFLLALLILIAYCKYQFNYKFNFEFKAISKSEYKKFSTYSFFILLAGISSIVSQYTDSIMLASIKGLNATGIYSIAFFLGMAIEMPKRAITSISSVLIAKHWNDNEQDKIQKLYSQSSINQGVIGLFLFILILINIDEIFYLLPKSEILSVGKHVAILIGLSRVIDMITGVNNEILRTSKFYKIDFLIILFFIAVSIITNLLLIPIFGLNGAAVSTLISVFLYNLVRYIILKKLFALEPFNINTLKLIIVSLLLITINYFIEGFSADTIIYAVLLIVIKSAIYSLIFIFLIYRLKVSEEINQIINKFIKK